MMSDEQQLPSGTVVWAKVEPYPWWPGKILQSIVQHQQTVYKVAFFADPTYTYLHRHQIKPYLANQISPNGLEYHQPALQHAIKMAEAFLSKQKSKSTHKNKETTIKDCFQNLHTQRIRDLFVQKSKAAEQREGILSSNISQNDQRVQSQTQIDEITALNVIKILEYKQRREKKASYCYQTRKKDIRFHDKLKQKLLERYNLISFSNSQHGNGEMHDQTHPFQITGREQKSKGEKKQKKISKAQYYRQICTTFEAIKLCCLKKVNYLLRSKKESGKSVRQKANQIIRRILLISNRNQMKFKSLFIALVRNLGNSSAQMACQQRLCDFKLYLQRIQGQKGEDEEGSRLTQVESTVN